MLKTLLLITIILTLSNCGEDRCDPTGTFGCDQYTTRYKLNIDNQTKNPIGVRFDSNKKCASAKGTTEWQIEPKSVLKTTMKFVNQGGGDGCDNWGDEYYVFHVGACTYEAQENFSLVYDGTCAKDGFTEAKNYK